MGLGGFFGGKFVTEFAEMEAAFVSPWIWYNFIEKWRGSDSAKMAATVTDDEMTGHSCPVISNQGWSVRHVVSLIKLNSGSYFIYLLRRSMIFINLMKFYV